MNGVLVVPRDEFLARYWDYHPGEHVTLLVPTTGGKTTLAHQLLTYSAGPNLPAVEMVMKPRDKVVTAWVKASGYRRVRTWPAVPHPLKMKPAGWVLWPKHTYDPDVDDPAHHRVFRAAVLDSYKRGDRILFADETMGLVELGIRRELVSVWTRGHGSGCGMWAASQRPRDIPLHAYSQAHHLFLGNTPDAADRKRYSEIGGTDPKLVSDTTMALTKYQFLYIRRQGEQGPEMCIVDK